MTSETRVHTKKSIGIIRVSTESQKDRYGPRSQQRDIDAGAERLGWDLIDTETFQESASDTDNRTKFSELLQRLVGMGLRGEIQGVILGRWDRLGRDGRNAGGYYLETLRRAGIEVRMGDTEFDVDPADPNYDAKTSEYFAESKTEVRKIRKRTMAGKRERALDGKLLQGSVPWPYDYQPKSKVGDASTGLPTLNTERAVWVRQWVKWIIEDHLSGMEIVRRMNASGVLPPATFRRVEKLMHAEHLDYDAALIEALKGCRISLQWTISTIHRILLNLGLLGRFYAYKKGADPVLVHEDSQLAIISQVEQEQIKAVLAENKRLAKRHTTRPYPPIKGFVWCGVCQRRAHGCYANGKPHFRCASCYTRDGNKMVQASGEQTWEEVKRVFSALVTDPSEIRPLLQQQLADPDNRRTLELRKQGIQDQLKAARASLGKLVALFASVGEGSIALETITGQINENENRQKSLQADLIEVETGLKASFRAALNDAKVLEVSGKLAHVLENDTSDEEWQALFREYNVKVFIEHGGKRTLQASLNMELSESIVEQQSR